MSALVSRDPAGGRDGPRRGNAGAVALAHIDSPDLGDFEDAMILKTFGDVPKDFDCLGS